MQVNLSRGTEVFLQQIILTYPYRLRCVYKEVTETLRVPPSLHIQDVVFWGN